MFVKEKICSESICKAMTFFLQMPNLHFYLERLEQMFQVAEKIQKEVGIHSTDS